MQSWFKIDYRHYIKHFFKYILMDPNKGIIKRNLIKEWQHSWDTGNTGRHLYAVQREVGTVRTTKRSTKEQNIDDKADSRTYQTQ